MRIDDSGSLFLQQDQWKNVSSLTLMSKGEKGVEFEMFREQSRA
jgi:hypothetical protein